MAVSKIITSMGFMDMLLLVSVALLSAGLAAAITLKVTGLFAGLVGRLDYRKLSLAVMAFLVAMAGLMTGAFGLLVLFTASAIGLTAPLLGVRRSHCMGCLMVPVVWWLLVAI